MKTRPRRPNLKGLIAVALLLGSWTLQARAEDVDDYESIVRGLSGSSRVQVKPSSELSPLDTSEIHLGLGIANELSNLRTAGGRNVAANQKGFQIALGIDLFSPRWIAEGTARTFSDQQNPQAQLEMREFDLRLLHRASLTRVFAMRAGGGVSGRYLKVSESALDGSGALTSSYTTPSSVALLGGEARFNSFLSVGTDVTYRSAMIQETIDQNSFDFVVRVDAHF